MSSDVNANTYALASNDCAENLIFFSKRFANPYNCNCDGNRDAIRSK